MLFVIQSIIYFNNISKYKVDNEIKEDGDDQTRKWYSDYLGLMEYKRNPNYGRTKCFHCLLSPDRDEVGHQSLSIHPTFTNLAEFLIMSSVISLGLCLLMSIPTSNSVFYFICNKLISRRVIICDITHVEKHQDSY